MSRFMHEQTAEYRAAAEQVAAILERPEGDRSLAEGAEAFAERVLRCRLGNAKPDDRGRCCIYRLIGNGRHNHQLGGRDVCGPWSRDNHARMYKNADGELFYVSQPYGLLSQELPEMVAFAQRHGLEFEVDAVSPYFYGSTLAVVWRRHATAGK